MPKFFIALAAFVIACGALSINLYESVNAGTYHIAQSPFSGVVAAKMSPGPYFQAFNTVKEWPVGETYHFTADKEGGPGDDSVLVTFNDGSTCRLSGTVRIELPKTEQEAVDLVVKHGFRSFEQLEDKLVQTALRNALSLTANMMTVRDSYSERRAEFIRLAQDQLENGVYNTKIVETKAKDPVSGQDVTLRVAQIITDSEGRRSRQSSVFGTMGIRVSQLEIKDWIYSEIVKKQIAAQQEATMAIQTAKANALKAEQDTLTAKSTGETLVAKVKYEQLAVSEKASQEAERDAKVAAITANKEVAVATLAKQKALVVAGQAKEVAQVELDAAKLQKQRTVELAEGEAKARELILAADGALDKKLDAFKDINEKWATAFANQKVPGVVMGSGTDGRSANTFMDILGAKAARDLALDMTLPVKGTK